MTRRTTEIPFRDWSWRARLVERLYRLTHGGQIRTLVLSQDQIAAKRRVVSNPWIPLDPDGLPPETYTAWGRQERKRQA